MSLIDDVQQHLGPAEIQQISQQLGIDPQAAQSAVQAALPMIVSGMSNAPQQSSGAGQAQSLFGGHGGALGNLTSAISGMTGGGAGGGIGDILGGMFGGQHKEVQDGVAQSTGLQPGQAQQLLMLLAPIVMRALRGRT